MKDSEREKIKLRANYLNGIALLLFGIGGLAPAMIGYRLLLVEAWSWPVFVVAAVTLWAGVMSSFEVRNRALKELDKLDRTNGDRD